MDRVISIRQAKLPGTIHLLLHFPLPRVQRLPAETGLRTYLRHFDGTGLRHAGIEQAYHHVPALTYWGPAVGEVQVATFASYVVYYEGQIERIKKLDFHDGYELAWMPKGRFTFPSCWLGMSPYVESGAGLSYVSETYRNSGSRVNCRSSEGWDWRKNSAIPAPLHWVCNGGICATATCGAKETSFTIRIPAPI